MAASRLCLRNTEDTNLCLFVCFNKKGKGLCLTTVTYPCVFLGRYEILVVILKCLGKRHFKVELEQFYFVNNIIDYLEQFKTIIILQQCHFTLHAAKGASALSGRPLILQEWYNGKY